MKKYLRVNGNMLEINLDETMISNKITNFVSTSNNKKLIMELLTKANDILTKGKHIGFLIKECTDKQNGKYIRMKPKCIDGMSITDENNNTNSIEFVFVYDDDFHAHIDIRKK